MKSLLEQFSDFLWIDWLFFYIFNYLLCDFWCRPVASEASARDEEPEGVGQPHWVGKNSTEKTTKDCNRLTTRSRHYLLKRKILWERPEEEVGDVGVVAAKVNDEGAMLMEDEETTGQTN